MKALFLSILMTLSLVGQASFTVGMAEQTAEDATPHHSAVKCCESALGGHGALHCGAILAKLETPSEFFVEKATVLVFGREASVMASLDHVPPTGPPRML